MGLENLEKNRNSLLRGAGTVFATAGGHQLVTCPLAKGTLPTYPLDSISTNVLASWELVKELVRVSRVSRPSPWNLLKVYEAPSDLLARPNGKNSTVPLVFNTNLICLIRVIFGHP